MIPSPAAPAALSCDGPRVHCDSLSTSIQGSPDFLGREVRENAEMSYVESNLIPGETLIYQTRLHWVVMIGHIVVGCLVLALPGALLLYYTHNHSELQNRELHLMQGAGAALILCGGIVILVGSVRRNATEMAVTTRRVSSRPV